MCQANEIQVGLAYSEKVIASRNGVLVIRTIVCFGTLQKDTHRINCYYAVKPPAFLLLGFSSVTTHI